MKTREELLAAAEALDTRKLCTCDGAGRGPGRACVVAAGERLGELWRCAEGREPAAVRAEKAELLKALVEARELVSGWADYADEYFKTKHRLTDDLAMLDAAINKARSNHG